MAILPPVRMHLGASAYTGTSIAGSITAAVPVTAAITWMQSAERGVWVAEGPGGQLMSVTRDTSGQWVPSVSGPGGQERWRGQPCRTRLAAQVSPNAGRCPCPATRTTPRSR